MNSQIMVVDDEPGLLNLVNIVLKRRGYAVMTANGPFAALSMLESSTPDLFILDMMMPGMDGAELCKRIRSRPETAHKPIIIFSANSDAASVARSLSAGADAHVSKSAAKDLVVYIQELIGQHSADEAS